MEGSEVVEESGEGEAEFAGVDATIHEAFQSFVIEAEEMKLVRLSVSDECFPRLSRGSQPSENTFCMMHSPRIVDCLVLPGPPRFHVQGTCLPRFQTECERRGGLPYGILKN